MTPTELLNLSLQYEVDVESHTHLGAQRLISFDFKGLNPLKITKMPLYLALQLQSLNLCTIKKLYYLRKDFLQNLIDKETQESNFVELPEFLFEHAYYFKDNEIESKICELKNLRMSKMWKGLANIDGKALNITGLTKWEYNEYKEYILSVIKTGKDIETEIN